MNWRNVGTIALCWGHSTSAMACPFCASETGKQVRAGIFNDDFLVNASLTLIPFPFLLAIVGLIYFGMPRPLGRERKRVDG